MLLLRLWAWSTFAQVNQRIVCGTDDTAPLGTLHQLTKLGSVPIIADARS